MKKARELFDTVMKELSPKGRRTLVFLLVAFLFLSGTLLAYYQTRGSSREAKPAAKEAARKIDLSIDRNLFEKSAYLEGKKELTKASEEKEKLEKENKELRDRLSELEKRFGGSVIVDSPAAPKGPAKAPAAVPPLPVPPAQGAQGGWSVPPPPAPAAPEKPELVGGIAVQSNTKASQEEKARKDREEDVKKKKLTVYLPPSFMAATLLSGLDAPAAEHAKGHPLPALLRIEDPAFLPNKVRADLSGCFVIAEGYGNLADERAHLRMTNLSCLSKKGRSVIDARVKGFVVDQDGKIGLRGEVASKMGAVIARSVIAGFFGGLGEAITQQTQTVAISPLGQTSTVDPGKVAQAGLGKGLSTAAQEIQRFYLELARQSVPVVQVGATRRITLVISEGAELEVKENKPIATGKGG